MILYDAQIEHSMRDYGILIPMSPARRSKILSYLREHGCRLPVLSFDQAAAAAKLEGDTGLHRADLERVHSPAYVAALYGEGPDPKAREKAVLECYELINPDGTYHRYDPSIATRPLTELVDGSIDRVRGSYLACRLALSDANPGPIPHFCFYMGGGSHHPRYDRASGFGLLNDPIISTAKILAEGRAKLIWYIDLDAHKGDGSAELIRFARDRGEQAGPVELLLNPSPQVKPSILYFSMHMAHGWPLDDTSLAAAEPGRAPIVPNDLDIGIDSGEEGTYLGRLQEGLAHLERLSGGRRPDLVVVEAGMDVYEKDGLPGTALLKMTLAQCLERDRYMFDWVTQNHYPSAWFLAGGYGDAVWEPTALFLQGVSDTWTSH
jgi:acetoin utilization deacetylase AcuC-like enzyme